MNLHFKNLVIKILKLNQIYKINNKIKSQYKMKLVIVINRN